PTPLPASEETWRTVPDDAAGAWGAAYRLLRELAMPAAGEEGGAPGVAPSPMRLTKAARGGYQDFTRQQAQEVNGTAFPDHLRGPWSKLRGYWGRLALIVQLLRWSCGEAGGQEVDDDSAGRASQLVAYFKGMARRVHAKLTADPRVEPAR